MNFLPVNLAGLFLIVLALAFFILEAKMPSHGVLALGGIVSMFLGAIFLIRSPLTPGGVSMGVALAATLPFAVLAVVFDAAGFAIAEMENGHGQGRVDRIARRRSEAAAIAVSKA